MEIFLWIVGLLVFIVVLALSVGIHEAFHMGVAKFFKLSVPRFAVGFGKSLWSFKTKKTEYHVKAIPLGGYVIIEDDSIEKINTEDLDRQIEDNNISDKDRKKLEKQRTKLVQDNIAERSLLGNVAPWKRILVYVAGPIANLIIGTVIIFMVLITTPIQYVTHTVDTVNVCSTEDSKKPCGASVAGIKPGDKIISIDGEKTADEGSLATHFKNKTHADVTVERDDKELTIHNVPVNNGYIGVNMVMGERQATVNDVVDTMNLVFIKNLEALSTLPDKVPGVMTSIFNGHVDEGAPSSIVAVGKEYGDTSASKTIDTDNKIRTFATLSGLFNLGLFFVNLLPLMPLDGGRVLVALMDSVKMLYSKIMRKEYKYVSLKTVNMMTIVTGSLVFSFMALVIASDIAQIIRQQI